MNHRLSWIGVGLFAFIPLVLVLLLRRPLGPLPSLGLAVAIIVAHRRFASRWVERHEGQRCAWCGRVGAGDRLEVESGSRTWRLLACKSEHAASAAALFGFVARWRVPIGLGIFVPLTVLAVSIVAAAAGSPLVPLDVASAGFRVIVAATVVSVSLLYRTAAPPPTLRSPFPVHNLCLLGIGRTLWVFRLVGLWWLASSLLEVVVAAA